MFKKIGSFLKGLLKGKSVTEIAIRGIKAAEAVKMLFSTGTAADIALAIKKLVSGLKQADCDKIRQMLCDAIDNLQVIQGIEGKAHLEEKLFMLQMHMRYTSKQYRAGIYKAIAVEFSKVAAKDAGLEVPEHILDLMRALEYANQKNGLGEDYGQV